MMSEWIVVLEATKPGSTAELDKATLSRLIEAVTDACPVALYNPDRYAIQLLIPATDLPDALALAFRHWSEAVRGAGAPAWDVVRADVMTITEFKGELEAEQTYRQNGAVLDLGATEPSSDGAASEFGRSVRLRSLTDS